MRLPSLPPLKITFRRLLHRPVFFVVAVTTIALAVGATTAVFSVANAILLRPLPFSEPDRLVQLEGMVGSLEGRVDATNMLDWAPSFRSLDGVAATARTTGANLTGAGEPTRVGVSEVTWDYFRVLGIDGVLGRSFLPEEAVPGRTAVAVMGHALWRDHFGGDSTLVGEVVNLNGRPVSVVGIAPAGLSFPGDAELWLPAAFGEDRIPEGSRLWQFIGRLRPGATVASVRSEMSALVEREFQGTWLEDQPPVVRPLHEAVVGNVRPALLLLLGAAGFVILIASANLANLFLARTGERVQELAIRATLGARPRRLAGEVLLEGTVVAGLGGVLGVLVGVWGLEAILAIAPSSVPRLETVGLDRTVLGVAFLVTALSALLFGLLPAGRAARTDIHGRVKAGMSSAGRGAATTSRGLVVVEVALTLMLAVGGALLIRSVQQLHAVDTGFDATGVLTASVSLPRPAYPDEAARDDFFDRAVERVRALPGVESAGATNWVPLATGVGFSVPIEIEGREEQPSFESSPTRFLVGTQYFDAMNIGVLAGRPFGEADVEGSPPVVVISRTVAESHWESPADALGARIREGGGEEWREVVGVVDEVRVWGLQGEQSPGMYLPYSQTTGGVSRIAIRTAGVEPAGLAAAVRGAIRELDPSLPVYDVRPLDGWVADHLAPTRFNATLLSVFAGLALLLAAVGIYGVVANQVLRRTHEIGVRVALGARRHQVLGMVVRQAVGLAAAGVLIGVAGGVALSRVLSGLVFEVSVTDPATYAVVAALLLGAAATASVLPARRALRIDPMNTLRID